MGVTNPFPSPDAIARAELLTRERFVYEGESIEEALAPGSARRRALDAAVEEVAAGNSVPSIEWRREFSLLLGLERLLSEEEPRLVDGTTLSAHQVDALSGTLTALLADVQRISNGNGRRRHERHQRQRQRVPPPRPRAQPTRPRASPRPSATAPPGTTRSSTPTRTTRRRTGPRPTKRTSVSSTRSPRTGRTPMTATARSRSSPRIPTRTSASGSSTPPAPARPSRRSASSRPAAPAGC